MPPKKKRKKELEDEDGIHFESEKDMDDSDQDRSIGEVIHGSPPDQRAVGWWQIVKVEMDEGTVQEIPADWVLARNIGADTYGHLRNHILRMVVPREGPGTYLVKACTQNRQVIPNEDFFTFEMKMKDEDGMGADYDPDKADLAHRKQMLKAEEEHLRLVAQEAKLKERKEEILGRTKKKFNPYLSQWMEYYEERDMPIPPKDDIPDDCPPPGGRKKGSSEMLEMMKMFMAQQAASQGSAELDMLRNQISLLESKLSEPKEDKMATMMFQMMQDEKLRNEEWRRKQEEEERKREEREERRREEMAARQDQERKEREREAKAEREAQDRREAEARRRHEEELRLHREDMERKDRENRERAQAEREQLFFILKMFKDDTNSSSKQLMEMTRLQSEQMLNASTAQFNLGTAATRSILEVASTIKDTIGSVEKKDDDPGITRMIIEQLGKVVAPYAEVDAKAKLAQAAMKEMGISPQQAQQVMEGLGIPPTKMPGMPGGLDSTPGPIPPNYGAPVPERRRMSEEYSEPRMQGAGSMGALIDKYMEQAPEIMDTILILMENGEVDDAVAMMIEQPATVRAIITNWPYEKIAPEICRNLSPEQVAVFKSDRGAAWWKSMQARIKEVLRLMMESDDEDDDEGDDAGDPVVKPDRHSGMEVRSESGESLMKMDSGSSVTVDPAHAS